MSDVESLKQLVLENQELLRQLRTQEAITVALLLETGPVSLKTADVEANAGRPVSITQTKTLIKLEVPDETTPV